MPMPPAGLEPTISAIWRLQTDVFLFFLDLPFIKYWCAVTILCPISVFHLFVRSFFLCVTSFCLITVGVEGYYCT